MLHLAYYTVTFKYALLVRAGVELGVSLPFPALFYGRKIKVVILLRYSFYGLLFLRLSKIELQNHLL